MVNYIAMTMIFQIICMQLKKMLNYIDNICRHFLIIMLEHHLAIVSILIQANGSQEMELFH